MPVGETPEPVAAKAVLVDPRGMTAVWLNEAASRDAEGDGAGSPIERAMPLPASFGLREALEDVARTGIPRHLSAGLVSTGRGSLAIVVSVYRVPGDMLLVLSDNTFRTKPRPNEGETPRARAGRRRR